MPYIKTLENREIAISPSAIFKEMLTLMESDIAKYKISFKQSGGDSVGVKLPVRFNEGRVCKKRWWEVEQRPSQLNLPFQLYQPAIILRRRFVDYRPEMQVEVQYTNDNGIQKCLLRCNDGESPSHHNNVVALQLHKIVIKFTPDAAEREMRMGLTILTVGKAALLLRAAMVNGLDIQTDGVAVNRVTGGVVGTDFRILPLGSRLSGRCEPLEMCRMRLRDGEEMSFYIERRRLRQLRVSGEGTDD